MTADYGMRAAVALDRLIAGPHRDKTVARLFDVSLRTAQFLRAGKYWTVNRLTQASALLGVEFDAALSGAAFNAETADIEARLDRVEKIIAQMVRPDDARLAPLAAPAVVAAGGVDCLGEGGRIAGESEPADRSGAPSQRGGESVAEQDGGSVTR